MIKQSVSVGGSGVAEYDRFTVTGTEDSYFAEMAYYDIQGNFHYDCVYAGSTITCRRNSAYFIRCDTDGGIPVSAYLAAEIYVEKGILNINILLLEE